MAVQKTPRTGLETYTDGSDAHPNRTKFNSERQLLDALVALAAQGATGARPVPGILNRLYWDTTVKRLYWDDGTAWNEITTNGGGGAGQEIKPGTAASEGASGRSARADHTHYLALATAAVDGAMAKADKAKLDAATTAATGGTLPVRDVNGRFQAGAPAVSGDVANKGYVDGQITTRATAAHTHTVADVTDATATGAELVKAASAAAARTTLGLGNVDNTADLDKPLSSAGVTALAGKANTGHSHAPADITGTLAPSQLPAATTAAQGALPAADKAKLDGASASSAPSTLMMTDANGRYQVNAPAVAADAANKGYVDVQVATRAAAAHTHPWADLTDVPATFAPSAHTHPWADITGKPATYAPSAHSHSGADITSGTINPDRIANATSSVDGLLSRADKAKLDTASSSSAANTLMMTDSGGRFSANSPTSGAHVANKTYVDAQVDTAAPANHTHTWNSITSKPSTFAPSSHTHPWSQITGTPDLVSVSYANNNYAYKSHTHSWGDIYGNGARMAWGGTYTQLLTPGGGKLTLYDSNIVQASGIYSNSVPGSSYRAVWVDSSGYMGYNLSSRKYKTNERAYQPGIDLLDAVEPKWFQYKKDVAEHGADGAAWHVNFIAEDLHDAGLTEYVSYDGKGTARENAETINEQLIVNALWAFAKAQHDQISALESRIADLEGH